MGHSSLETAIDEFINQCSVRRTIEKKEQKTIHDAIHGPVVLENYIASIVDLPVVQRLREIKQLGGSDRLYPTANHTRFEHSIGVYHVAGKILNRLEQIQTVEITEAQKREVRVAALLHDIGHLPFSHMSERFLENVTGIKDIISNENFIAKSEVDIHEYLACKFLRTDYFRNIFNSINNVYGTRINVENVCDIIIGHSANPGYKYLANIVHGPIDADRIDYLQRDTHNIGFPSIVDSDRLIDILTPVDDPEENETKLGIEEKGIRAAESLFIARDRLYASCHDHHLTLVAEEQILRSIYQNFSDSPMDLIGMTDHELMCNVSEKNREFEKYRYRQLPKRYAYYQPSNSTNAGLALESLTIKEQVNLEEKISKYLGTDVLTVRSGMRNLAKSDIGDTIVDIDGEIQEIIIDLNRTYDSASVRSAVPQLQIHVDWEHLKSTPAPEELDEVKTITETTLDLDSKKLSDNGYTTKEYTGLKL